KDGAFSGASAAHAASFRFAQGKLFRPGADGVLMVSEHPFCSAPTMGSGSRGVLPLGLVRL
ncbi:MAG: hypothetical protein ACUVWR_05165, partial [Anaerolineae bacterium]